MTQNNETQPFLSNAPSYFIERYEVDNHRSDSTKSKVFLWLNTDDHVESTLIKIEFKPDGHGPEAFDFIYKQIINYNYQ